MLTQDSRGSCKMSTLLDRQQMVDTLRHLMAASDTGRDFSQPSLLEDVPSITAPDSGSQHRVIGHAELWGRPQRDC